MRSSLALIAAAGVAVIALAGCASASAPAATPGDSSSAVTVRGEFGEMPRVSFPTPLSPAETQCTEVIEGEGDYLQEGQVAEVGLAYFSGASGELAIASGFGASEQVLLPYVPNTPEAFNVALGCAREGSRVVVVAPAEAAFGEQGNPSVGIQPGDSVVVVMDVARAFPGRADGAVALSRDGFPAVVLAPNGQPGVTVPNADPPASTQTEVLKRGSGETVESGDQLLVQYTAVNWASGEVTQSSWESGTPGLFVVSEDGSAQAPPGLSEELIGQTVGSQVGVIVVPEDGSDVIFYVIDILGVA
ncbi:FKBP-type peptidyl-prolyl cis-trans isomerase [Agromyces silvae]|uniref:FKBP-type peptidyl-prolyl cis-trans isomerase n=1 Tax=Agromyces silvae TaxID=3388266 RepID=UPI00280A6A9B|nr:FKBP-type peptidyl-prolyl cis-trans isomerase [Agromyces protaetiae]